jgi:hypothetical protein
MAAVTAVDGQRILFTSKWHEILPLLAISALVGCLPPGAKQYPNLSCFRDSGGVCRCQRGRVG